VAQGGAATVSLAAVTGGSFAGTIGFSLAGLPPGLTATWQANPITVGEGESTNAVMLTRRLQGWLCRESRFLYLLRRGMDSVRPRASQCKCLLQDLPWHDVAVALTMWPACFGTQAASVIGD